MSYYFLVFGLREGVITILTAYRNALRRMLIRNAIYNCIEECKLYGLGNGIIPLFDKREHASEAETEPEEITTDFAEMNNMLRHLDHEQHCQFVSNVLYHIARYIIAQILSIISCSACNDLSHHQLIQVNNTVYLPGITKHQKHHPLPILSKMVD